MSSFRPIEFETQRSLLVAMERPTLITSLLRATAAALPIQKPQAEPQEIAFNFAAAFVKAESVATTKALLQYGAVETLPTQSAVALTKDLPRHALRTYELEESRFSSAYEVALYAPFALFFTHLSTYLVQQAIDTYRYVTAPVNQGSPQNAVTAFHKASQKNAKILVNSVLFGSLGYALGTLIFPGRGTMIVGVIFEVIPYIA